jgi:flagellar protein FliS
MFNTIRGGYGSAAAYANVGYETGVTSADPHQLIVMLFDGAITCVGSAREHMLKKDISAKGENISKAINIVSNGLKVSLDTTGGGELAQRLSALYDYMSERLLFANMRDDPAALDEVKGLLRELRDAWQQIGRKQSQNETGTPISAVA